jgi:hypothetical protein
MSIGLILLGFKKRKTQVKKQNFILFLFFLSATPLFLALTDLPTYLPTY